ncbi:glycoside hydrolase 43 family protein [Sphingomonas sp. Root241]|uniref:glycoside hydrolase family 43 protein n=1 Tax=Sphingomonas sp. Root241 TaxID=1736501 RepID=UPI001910B3C1|nr:glycoside hydrolase 43 family protein [Sphingomonas sp. Root241]
MVPRKAGIAPTLALATIITFAAAPQARMRHQDKKRQSIMRHGSKSSGIIISGLVSCAALTLVPCAAPAFAQNRDAPAASASKGMSAATWTPDNGDGTFTNPLFYDEFSDPDLIRVGEWFYLTGTTMHAMPGLPILRSKDLVNWEFVAYALDKLDLGPAYRLEDGRNIYGQGIWAPSFRYHDGKFYIFSNVNDQTTQMFTATDPKGPWTRTPMKRSFHDLSVLFDDDGKVYVVWGHQDMHLAQLTDDLTDVVPGTERVLFAADAGMGEGAHFYKIDGKYYIISANYAGGFRMPAARADHVLGPYEVNRAISLHEDFGMAPGPRLKTPKPPFDFWTPGPAASHGLAMHQGGIVQTPEGEWWGFSMMDFNSVGRLLSLSPITWKDGWPYFGLQSNLTRTPRTWVKPKTATPQPMRVPFQRSDDFSAPRLQPLWQWNHVPVDDKWSLSERPGFLRLHALPATSFYDARNTLTQRAIGPMSTPTVLLDASSLKPGDTAGLGLLNLPYATLGVEKRTAGLDVVFYDQRRDHVVRVKMTGTRIWLRADCDFLTERARFSYSFDGVTFTPIGNEVVLVYQTFTFQGVRYGLFSYNATGAEGGFADFDSIQVYQPHTHGLMQPIPYGRSIRLTSFRATTGLAAGHGRLASGAPTRFEIVDRRLGRVALRSGRRYVTVAADGAVTLEAGQSGTAQTFQWIETPTGELVLMSLATDRFLRIDPKTRDIRADSPGPMPDDSDGARFIWSE